jgi:CheY-like chemotaxis protein
MQLLLADDDIDDIELFYEAVKEVQPDAELAIAHTGRQLLSRLQGCTPAIIFLDINMPEMNGWQCLKFLKSDAMWKHIPVIIYTTSSSKRDVEIANDLGAYKLVTKPDRFRDLLKMLSEIITEIEGEYFGARNI